MAKNKKTKIVPVAAPAAPLVLSKSEKASRLAKLKEEIAVKDSALERCGGELSRISASLSKLIVADGFFVAKQDNAVGLLDQATKIVEKIKAINEEKAPLVKDLNQTNKAETSD